MGTLLHKKLHCTKLQNYLKETPSRAWKCTSIIHSLEFTTHSIYNQWNIIILYLYFIKNIDLGCLNLKISYCCYSPCLFTTFSLNFLISLKTLVKFGQSASKIQKINTVSTLSTICNLRKNLTIPLCTNRNGVSYQLHYPPWSNQ